MSKGKSKGKSKAKREQKRAGGLPSRPPAPIQDGLVDWIELVEGKELERAARALWGYVKDSEFGQELGPAKVADLAYGVLWAAGATPHHREVARRDQVEAARLEVLAALGLDPEEYSPETFGEVLAQHRAAMEWKRSVEAEAETFFRGPTRPEPPLANAGPDLTVEPFTPTAKAKPDNVAQGGVIGDRQAAQRFVSEPSQTYEYRMKNPVAGMASYVLSAYMQDQGWVIERRPALTGHRGRPDDITPWERILP